MTDVTPFTLVREEGIGGASGVGVVADGVLWPDGTASVRWRGEHPSVVYWPRGLVSAKDVNGQDGDVLMVLANAPGRLSRIAEAHVKEVISGGLTSGLCVECRCPWPCPTYAWASSERDPVRDCWDPADDEPKENDDDA